MKKIILIALASTVLASCGCQGWSCKKRYVDVRSNESNRSKVA